MEFRRMEHTDVSRLAFGTWHLSGDWGPVDENMAIRAIHRARDLGVNVFDTAQAYGFGLAESILGRALSSELRLNRDEIVIATKGGIRPTATGVVRDSSPKWLREGLESSLSALGIEAVDVYQVHWPDGSIPIAEVAGTMNELVAEGKARYVGVSNYDQAQLAEFSAATTTQTVQVPYNFLRPEAGKTVIPAAAESGMTVLTYSPLAHGILSGSVTGDSEYSESDWRSTHELYMGEQLERQLHAVDALRAIAERTEFHVAQLAYGYVLANTAIDVVIAGTLRTKYLEEAVDCVDHPLPGEVLDEMHLAYMQWQSDGGPR